MRQLIWSILILATVKKKKSEIQYRLFCQKQQEKKAQRQQNFSHVKEPELCNKKKYTTSFVFQVSIYELNHTFVQWHMI